LLPLEYVFVKLAYYVYILSRSAVDLCRNNIPFININKLFVDITHTIYKPFVVIYNHL